MTLGSQEMLGKVREIAERIVVPEGLELVDAEWKGNSAGGSLRIFIDKQDGITHADCEKVSRQLSVVLDVEDMISSSYTLEVSSPGLDRKLSKLKDFQRFVGHKATVRMREPLLGVRQVTARIESSSDSKVHLLLPQGEMLAVPLENIEQARLVVEFQKERSGLENPV